MKRIMLLLVAVFGLTAFSANGFSVTKPAGTNDAPSLAMLQYINASEFVKLSARDYTKFTGKKLNFLQRMSFGLTKMKMKHDLKKNPGLKITDYINGEGTTFQIDILWLLLGLILPVLGVLISYLTKQESYKITSSWIGFGAFILVAVIFGGSIF